MNYWKHVTVLKSRYQDNLSIQPYFRSPKQTKFCETRFLFIETLFAIFDLCKLYSNFYTASLEEVLKTTYLIDLAMLSDLLRFVYITSHVSTCAFKVNRKTDQSLIKEEGANANKNFEHRLESHATCSGSCRVCSTAKARGAICP